MSKITVNGIEGALESNGMSSSGTNRSKATLNIPGLGRVFVTVYHDRTDADTAAKAAPKVRKQATAEAPDLAALIQEQIAKALSAVLPQLPLAPVKK